MKQADEAGRLIRARKYQVIDLSTVENELEKFASNKEKIVDGKLIKITPFQQRMDYLSEAYPRLYIFILKYFDMNDKIEDYMTKCKSYEEDPNKYSLYVHGYFRVWLYQQRKADKLK